VNREQAARKVAALYEMKVERGCSPSEASAAAAKARDLVRRFGLTSSEPRRGAPRRPPPRPQKAWAPTADTSTWWFDVKTGQASKNVRVKEYRNVGNWRIEIDL
jgi:hypothetical protein